MIINRLRGENNCIKVFLYQRKVLYLTIIKNKQTMSNLINITGIHTVNYIDDRKITNARFVTKCKAGWMTVCDARDFQMDNFNKHPETLISGYKKGALQTVEVEFENSGFYIPVFPRVGKKIKLIDEAILVDVKVGTINSMFYNTELYNWEQYKAVNSKTWDSYAYQMNQPVSEPAI